ncbi:MAG: hypothetical protein HQL32_06240 [Planctomycetes bacterium]|nr:hypothetical protein [Planctomycetota bacterium]
MHKILWLASLLMVSISASLSATPKGDGFDIIIPSPVADPDLTSDIGAATVGLALGLGGDTDTKSAYVNYQVASFSSKTSLSISALYGTHEYTSGPGKLEGTEMQFDLLLTRNFIKFEENPNDWRPAKFSLSMYCGLGFSSSDTEVVNTDPTSGIENLNIEAARNLNIPAKFSSTATGIPLIAGAYINGMITRRFGYDSFLDVRQYFLLSGDVYGSPAPLMNLGTNFVILKRPNSYFPLNFYVGALFSFMNNSADDGLNTGLSIGFRNRW